MSRTRSSSPILWLAGLAAGLGLVALLVLFGRDESDPVRLSVATTMALGGAAVLVRVGIIGERWERLMAGSGARRFFGILVASAALLVLGAGLLLVRHVVALAP